MERACKRVYEVEGVLLAMEKRKEACENCVYNKKWFCCIVIDHVKRGGHCSEYEERKKKIDTP